MPQIDVPVVEKKKPGKEYVTMPESDVLDRKFPIIRVNHRDFKPGETYELEAELASTVKERIKAWQKSQLRLVQPKSDDKSIETMTKNGQGGGGYVNPNTLG